MKHLKYLHSMILQLEMPNRVRQSHFVDQGQDTSRWDNSVANNDMMPGFAQLSLEIDDMTLDFLLSLLIW
jgi:hypothetical protein